MIDSARVMELLKIALEGGSQTYDGVVQGAPLNGDALQPHRAEIVAMLEQLPDPFMDDGGGGWSFLNLCQLKDGSQWTDLHQRCEALIFLAQALELATWLFPRDMWAALPGGMPYVVIRRTAFGQAVH